MNDQRTGIRQRFRPTGRFSLGRLLGVVLVSASLLGWYSATQSATKYQEQLQTARDRATSLESIYQLYANKEKPVESTRRLFSNRSFDDLDFYGVYLVAARGFQEASFKWSNFQNSRIEMGPNSFSRIQLDNANLQSAKFEAGTNSFYETSFVSADLRSATLIAKDGSFESCSFRNANLTDAAIFCEKGFTNNDISAANFDGTDLSHISAESLQTCFFGGAPTYSTSTKLPQNFDAKAAGWKLKE